MEKELQEKILKHLRDNRLGYFFKFHNGPYGARGVSDIVGTYRGVAVFMEVKTEKGRLTKLQDKFLRDVKKEGAIAGVVRSIEDARGLIAQAKLLAVAMGTKE
jgi:hypothetical protein